ncbi:hypothetical protein [Streptomyces niveus]|uniref:hypothetical protein n=1 Tax=Streptomyces niveus TaxID=193462 RepID=UPI0034410BD9
MQLVAMEQRRHRLSAAGAGQMAVLEERSYGVGGVEYAGSQGVVDGDEVASAVGG